jgi:hypothetical protein
MERILQTLIAYMSRTERHFIDHLLEKFVEPMTMVQHEHDYRDADDYAEEFIRAVGLIEPTTVRRSGESLRDPPEPVSVHTSPSSATSVEPIKKDRVQLRHVHGIWEVTLDGQFSGHYRIKEPALAAAALLNLSLSSSPLGS